MSTPLSLYPIPGDSANASVIAVDRAIAELRRGGLVVVAARAGEHPVVAQAAEAATPASLKRLKLLSGKTPTLAVTGRRAAALTLCAAADSPEIVLVSTERGLDAESILGLVHPLETPPASLPLSASPVDPASGEGAAIRLAKLARLLPSAVSVPLPVEDAAAWAGRNNLPLVFADDVFEYDRTAARSLRPVSDARVPLAGAEETRIVAFRPEDGGIEHLAIIIGDPRPDQPVLTRLH
ncbi:MAG: GTP cyclohydrolase II, partial [Alphaproteobacteria bacterium]|nr:GTP cyclohydrolase II [Alphaproteobacteria bacterium]